MMFGMWVPCIGQIIGTNLIEKCTKRSRKLERISIANNRKHVDAAYRWADEDESTREKVCNNIKKRDDIGPSQEEGVDIPVEGM